VTRGAEAFEVTVQKAVDTLIFDGRDTASNEIHEAINDLSRRPKPDVTGSIQHSMAALECVARDICGDNGATLGKIMKQYEDILPKPLNEVVSKTWGYASGMGRHLRENQVPTYEDAELVVGISATIATYMSKKNREIDRQKSYADEDIAF